MPGSFIVFLVAAFLFVLLRQKVERMEGAKRGGGIQKGGWRPKQYKTGRVHGIWYDSSYERDYIRYAVELDRSIKSIRRYDEVYGPKPYSYGGKMLNYYPDFVVRHVGGKERIIEIKGAFSRKSKAKYRSYGNVVKWYFAPACMDIKRKVEREALPLAELKRRGLYEPGVSRVL